MFQFVYFFNVVKLLQCYSDHFGPSAFNKFGFGYGYFAHLFFSRNLRYACYYTQEFSQHMYNDPLKCTCIIA